MIFDTTKKIPIGSARGKHIESSTISRKASVRPNSSKKSALLDDTAIDYDKDSLELSDKRHAPGSSETTMNFKKPMREADEIEMSLLVETYEIKDDNGVKESETEDDDNKQEYDILRSKFIPLNLREVDRMA